MHELFLTVGTYDGDIFLHHINEEGDDDGGYQCSHHVSPSHDASCQQDEYAVHQEIGVVGMKAHHIIDDGGHTAQSARDNLIREQEDGVSQRVDEYAKNDLGIVTQQITWILPKKFLYIHSTHMIRFLWSDICTQ